MVHKAIKATETIAVLRQDCSQSNKPYLLRMHGCCFWHLHQKKKRHSYIISVFLDVVLLTLQTWSLILKLAWGDQTIEPWYLQCTKIWNSVYERKCDNRMLITHPPVWHTLHLCWSFSVNRTCRRNTGTPKSLWAWVCQICFLFCTAWVVVLQNTNASKAFFHRGVITVHHWCLLFLSLLFTVHVKLKLEMSDFPSEAPNDAADVSEITDYNIG